MTDEDFWDLLEKHDWTHAMSDDNRVFEAGAKNEAFILSLTKDQEDDWRQCAFDAWKAHKFSCGKVPKPEIDDDPAVWGAPTSEDAKKEPEKPATPPKVEKADHSLVSPSNLKNLDACPHYQGNNENELSKMHPNTVGGLRTHLAVELYFDPDKENNLEGQDIELFQGLEDEHYERGDYAIDYAERIIREFGSNEPDILLTEPRLHTHEKNTYGRCDLVAIWNENKHAIIFDWKDGMGYQGDASDNLQGKAYALGVMTEYPEVLSVDVHFVYTRLEIETTAQFTRARDVPKFQEKITDINERFERAQAGESLHAKCDSCQYCIHQTAKCPQWVTMVPDVVQDSKLKNSDMKPRTWDLAELSEMPEDLGKALAIMAFFEKYQKQLKEVALQAAQDDDLMIPGYKLVESNSGITCSDADGAYLVATGGGRLTMEEFLECIRTLTPGKLIKKMAAKTHEAGDFKSKAAAEKHWRAELLESGIIVEGTSYAYLKPGKE